MLTLVAAAIAGIVALAVVVRLVEPRIAFFPTSGETTTPADAGVPFTAETVKTADGERLHVWRITHPADRALVVYFHGNGGNLSIWAPILAGIAHHGLAVLAFDYRGYGLSTGRPTERGLYRDVEAILAALPSDGRRLPIVYWGRSLGTAMAAYASTVRQPDGVILESGFPDARSLVRSSPPMAFLSLFSTYRFPTADLMRRAHAPALVVHGDRDSVVPFRLGRALFDAVAEPKHFVTIRGGDHNDIAPPDPGTYWSAIDAFLTSLARRPASSHQP